MSVITHPEWIKGDSSAVVICQILVGEMGSYSKVNQWQYILNINHTLRVHESRKTTEMYNFQNRKCNYSSTTNKHNLIIFSFFIFQHSII